MLASLCMSVSVTTWQYAMFEKLCAADLASTIVIIMWSEVLYGIVYRPTFGHRTFLVYKCAVVEHYYLQ
jgi:hypothetical protein